MKFGTPTYEDITAPIYDSGIVVTLDDSASPRASLETFFIDRRRVDLWLSNRQLKEYLNSRLCAEFGRSMSILGYIYLSIRAFNLRVRLQ